MIAARPGVLLSVFTLVFGLLWWCGRRIIQSCTAPLEYIEIVAAAKNWMSNMSGTGTETDPKIIRTAEDLARVVVMVNTGYNTLATSAFAWSDSDVYLKLGDNIDLADYSKKRYMDRSSRTIAEQGLGPNW